ncbi:DUF5000 domain-containing lipoprotein [Pararcticibacter amylolyticus]|uniref:Fibronectin type-III domain-containing protein n=1 Tax=Pararcticibacter amylolyticus TaxID=2173175 RepID=A0A2U2PGL6_9SPHI|nr:DUF5000 domain-containing lipoprotein [Pararcticibacter amylolyticus]PWG80558.1 hypothetical protein DDR33_11010 [Pararcticibacter amylolyticus]
MKQVSKFTTIICFLLAILYGCKKEERLDHFDADAPAPRNVDNIKVTSTPGGAILTYDIPADPNLSYVRAVYEIQPGVFKEAKSSVYTDTLRLEGFGDTKQYEVKVYGVGRNEKGSEPATVMVQPLTPPVYSAFNDLTIEPGFGGIKVKLKNAYKANLAIVIEADTLGNGIKFPLRTFYTNSPEASYAVRGLSATEKKFYVYLRDRWNNKSDTLEKTLTPYFEQPVAKPYDMVKLPTDSWEPTADSYPMSRMWDGLVDIWIFASKRTKPLPVWFTIDLKSTYTLSRMKMHQRGSPYTYTGGNVKRFELYGSNSPDIDGGWSNWQLLGTFDSTKPSRKPSGATTEDVDYAFTQGEDFELTETPPPYRYVRIKVMDTWGGDIQVWITELSFFGEKK